MPRSMSSDRLGKWDDDSNRPHKKLKYTPTRSETNVIKDDADSSTKMRKSIPESNRWVVTRYLGNCRSYGSVYLAESTIDGDEDDLPFDMTIKSIAISQAQRLMNEKRFLTRFKNPFVVSWYGHELEMREENKEEKMYYNTIVEYCPGGSLEEHIKRHKGRIPEDDVKSFASDILVGLKYIHGEKIIHCDIKPKNIVLVNENKRFGSVDGFAAKISGFGKAMEKGSVENGEGWGRNQRRRTTRYMSPELIRDMVFDYGTDVWAFGCTVYEMLTGEDVLKAYGKHDREGWIDIIDKSGIIPFLPDYLSEKAKDFLTKCLEKDPAKRWSVDSLLKHQFLKWIAEDDEEEEEEEVEEEEEEEEEEERYEEEVEVVDDEIEDEGLYDDIEDADVEGYVANLEAEAAFRVEEEAIEIDEEYPKADSDDGL